MMASFRRGYKPPVYLPLVRQLAYAPTTITTLCLRVQCFANRDIATQRNQFEIFGIVNAFERLETLELLFRDPDDNYSLDGWDSSFILNGMCLYQPEANNSLLRSKKQSLTVFSQICARPWHKSRPRHCGLLRCTVIRTKATLRQMALG